MAIPADTIAILVNEIFAPTWQFADELQPISGSDDIGALHGAFNVTSRTRHRIEKGVKQLESQIDGFPSDLQSKVRFIDSVFQDARSQCIAIPEVMQFFAHRRLQLEMAAHDGWIAAANDGIIAPRQTTTDEEHFANLQVPYYKPTVPRAPKIDIAATAKDIPRILSDIEPPALVASQLVERLQEKQHSRFAAHWAIYEQIEAKRLTAEPIRISASQLIDFLRASGTGEAKLETITQKLAGCGVVSADLLRTKLSDGIPHVTLKKAIKHIEQSGPGIQLGKPAPWNHFKVAATDALWEWWQTQEADTPSRKASGASDDVSNAEEPNEPPDPTAYERAATLRSQRVETPNHKALMKSLKKHGIDWDQGFAVGKIRRWYKGQHLYLHAGDWSRYWTEHDKKAFDALGNSDQVTDAFMAESESRRESLRDKKRRG